MSINIGGYDFEGPFNDPDEIKKEIGVYVVICLVDGLPHCILDIGTSEGGTPTRGISRVVTKTGNLKHRLRTHKRRNCWDEKKHGEIGYAVRYIQNTDERLAVEKELQWKFNYPCGDNYWKNVELAWREYKKFERQFGSRGSGKIKIDKLTLR
jgi:hypothetical protein